MALLSSLISLFTSKWQLVAFFVGTWMVVSATRRVIHVLTSPFPGPKLAKFTQWWIRSKQFQGKDLQTIHSLHQKYGPIVQLGPHEVSFCHADALTQIYAGPRGLDAAENILPFQHFASENVVTTLDADLHAVRRKMIVGLYSAPAVAAPAFQAGFKKYIDEFMQVIEDKASASLSRTVDVSSWLRWLAGDIIIHLIFGETDHPKLLTNEKSRELYKELLITATDALSHPLPTIMGWFPRLVSPVQKIFGPDNMGAFGMKRVEATLTNNSGEKEGFKTHLQHLLAILKKNGPSDILPDEKFIASDCLDHFVAGFFSLADLFSALLWHLSLPENQARQEKLRQELHNAGIPPETHPDLLVVQKLPYLNCILRELLRVHHPIPIGLQRKVKKGQDVVVLGAKIPPGTKIHSQAYSVHRDETVFPDAERWIPERWDIPITSPEYREMQRMFWPFGSGARMCSGMNVAWAELRLVTARVYSTYETALDEAFLDKNGALLSEKDRKGYFPFALAEPIRFLRN